MNSYDNMDLDEMLNKPFKHLNLNAKKPLTVKPHEKRTPVQKAHHSGPLPRLQPEEDTAEKNHSLMHRMLSLEKNVINADKKILTLKSIIEHQNQRIDMLEEELSNITKQFE